MTDVDATAGSIDEVRRDRRAIGAAARRLVELDDASGKVVRGLSWTAFERLPAWCLAPETRRASLQLTCGALRHLPDIQRSLDGARLRSWRRVLGDELFDALAALDPPGPDVDGVAVEPVEPVGSVAGDSGGAGETAEAGSDDEPATRAATGGAAVLLGTLHDASLRELFAPLLGRAASIPDRATAEALLEAGTALLDGTSS